MIRANMISGAGIDIEHATLSGSALSSTGTAISVDDAQVGDIIIAGSRENTNISGVTGGTVYNDLATGYKAYVATGTSVAVTFASACHAFIICIHQN